MSDQNERIDALRRDVAANPASVQFYQLAELLRREGQADEAIAVLRRGLATHTRYVAAWVSLGRALSDQGKAIDASTALAEAIRLDAQNPVAWRLLGEARLASDQQEGALSAFRHAMALAPGDEALAARVDDLAGEIAKREGASPDQESAVRESEPPDLGSFDEEPTSLAAPVGSEPEGAVDVNGTTAVRIDPFGSGVVGPIGETTEREAAAITADIEPEELPHRHVEAETDEPAPVDSEEGVPVGEERAPAFVTYRNERGVAPWEPALIRPAEHDHEPSEVEQVAAERTDTAAPIDEPFEAPAREVMEEPFEVTSGEGPFALGPLPGSEGLEDVFELGSLEPALSEEPAAIAASSEAAEPWAFEEEPARASVERAWDETPTADVRLPSDRPDDLRAPESAVAAVAEAEPVVPSPGFAFAEPEADAGVEAGAELDRAVAGETELASVAETPVVVGADAAASPPAEPEVAVFAEAETAAEEEPEPALSAEPAVAPPFVGPATVTMARLYIQQQQLGPAVDTLERLLDAEPDNQEARDLLELVRDMMEPLPVEMPPLSLKERKIAALQRWLASLTLGHEGARG